MPTFAFRAECNSDATLLLERFVVLKKLTFGVSWYAGMKHEYSLILFITYNYIFHSVFFRLGWVPTLLLAQAHRESQLLLCLHLDGSLPHYPPFHHTPRPCQPAGSLPQPSDPLPPTPPFTAPMTVASAMILLQPLRQTTLTMRLQGKLKDIWNIY